MSYPDTCYDMVWSRHNLKLKVQTLVYKTGYNIQGMVDGSASKPALRQDTGYMVDKTDLDIALYSGFFGAYLMPQ